MPELVNDTICTCVFDQFHERNPGFVDCPSTREDMRTLHLPQIHERRIMVETHLLVKGRRKCHLTIRTTRRRPLDWRRLASDSRGNPAERLLYGLVLFCLELIYYPFQNVLAPLVCKNIFTTRSRAIALKCWVARG